MKLSPVLMYHRIGDVENRSEKKYCVSPGLFRSHMERLARTSMRAVSIDDYIAWLQGKYHLPNGAFLLTFDDGFEGVYKHAYPLLLELGWTATVFLVSDLIGAWDDWHKKEDASGASYPLLSTAQIREMQEKGFSFQSHTRRHHDLTSLGDDALIDELAGSKRELEGILAGPVNHLAYPYGLNDTRVREAAATADYKSAFSVQSGFNRPGSTDLFNIRRLDIYGTDSASDLERKVKFGSNNGSVRNAARYYASRFVTRLKTR